MSLCTIGSILLILILSTHSALAAETGVGTFREAPCPFELPEGVVQGENFIFGYVTVPEQHEHPEGPTIQIAVGIFPSRSENPNPDPLVLTAGGPGEDMMASFIPSFTGEGAELLLATRAAIGIAVRGTRYSKPDLLCQEIYDTKIPALGQNFSGEETMMREMKALRAAHDRFIAEGINLAAYNSVELAADVAMVVTALGYEKFNLFGNSGATLLTQHVMRYCPERLRSVILSSPAPVGVPIFEHGPANGVKTLQEVFQRFAADESANSAYPNLESRFLALLDTLNENPIELPIKNRSTGEDHTLLLNGYRLAQWLFMKMYGSPQYAVELGKIVSGDYTAVQTNPGILFPLHGFSHGLQYSIICSELANQPSEDIPTAESYSVFAEAASLLWFGPRAMKIACEIWDVPELSEEAREPVKCDVPTLILCGEFDHVCPPWYGELIAQNLSQAYVYTFPGVAHAPIDAGSLPILMLIQFLEDPTTEPDSSGIAEYKLKFMLE